MNRYRVIWKTVLIGLFLYMVIGFLTFDIKNKKSNEVFPVFSWFLFAEVPQKNHIRYTIRIYEIDGKTLPVPLLFAEAGAYSNPHSVSANKLIQDLGKALVENQIQEVKGIRELLEQNQIHRVNRYELIQLTYDPVERFKTGKAEEKSIAFFQKGIEIGATP